jgi:hypothetical protein
MDLLNLAPFEPTSDGFGVNFDEFWDTEICG